MKAIIGRNRKAEKIIILNTALTCLFLARQNRHHHNHYRTWQSTYKNRTVVNTLHGPGKQERERERETATFIPPTASTGYTAFPVRQTKQ